MLYWYRKGGHNREINRRIPRISPSWVLYEAKVAKGGAYLRDTMVLHNVKTVKHIVTLLLAHNVASNMKVCMSVIAEFHFLEVILKL